jgi:hypothetical protein
MPILLEENNVISLRTAYVHDGGNLVSFSLDPADMLSMFSEIKKQWAPKDFEWVSKDHTWLYRHLRSPSDEEKLMQTFPPIVENDIKPLVFTNQPEFKLLWADSGHSVALYLNGEPWAFIEETTHEGYSKGILLPKEPYITPSGKLWDQGLFERIFPDAPPKIELAKK